MVPLPYPQILDLSEKPHMGLTLLPSQPSISEEEKSFTRLLLGCSNATASFYVPVDDDIFVVFDALTQ
jgi:hypothetical protein